ncbi:MAG: cell filamentation protein Fic [Clostridia bacterium]|nr:cell filamentation protein Fic [Clostridia bacterium]
MEDFYNTRNSIYCYPGTNILINKLDIHDSNKLFKLEKQIVLAKSYILRQNKGNHTFDKKHFLYIHKFLFEDLYPFAGKFRTENISKGEFTFAWWEYIESELDRLLNELKSENYLEGLNKKDLSKRLAYYLSELNVLHPFREGNGRTIREFIRELAFKNGYVLDLQNTTPEEIFNACVKSVYDTTDLEAILYNCLKENK